MAKQRIIFVEGAMERNVGEDLANMIFDQMETFAGYGFNKSHSAAYALIAYQTAWLKTHHQGAFMAAVLSADMDNTDKVDEIIHECRDLRLEVLPPDINRSVHAFTDVDDRSILYGLGAIKGVGHAAIDMIVLERETHGPFSDLSDFCNRIEHQKVNRRAMDVLVRSGALDALDPDGNRARMLHELPDTVQAAEQYQRDRESGQVDLFGSPGKTAAPRRVDHVAVRPWTRLQTLQAEKESLGLYLTGHPVELQAQDLGRFATCFLGQVADRMPRDQPGQNGGRGNVVNLRRGTPMVLAGQVRAIRRRGNRGGFVAIEDHTGSIEVALFDEAWTLYADVINKDEIIVVEGQVSADDFSGGYRLSAQKVMPLAEAKSRFARGVQVALRGPHE
ncbi:MAG TPA: OB-fold nucleic acid binding domain-containing protein, partial [Xanthomonadales bacterium]|nr:OB-fold nucleic acid binding domain-containing protein [Xanthomonadales bacterium]